MKKLVLLSILSLLYSNVIAQKAYDANATKITENKELFIESAADAVKNMKVGWNLGNTLDSNSGDTLNMWIERWNSKPIAFSKYDEAWGQKVPTRKLIHMFKEAGFNAIRIPVTWYPHMGIKLETSNPLYWYRSKWTSSTVESSWMAHVKEVVDYVIDEGMYCILNVHHDTGDANTAWIRADMKTYEKEKVRYESLWTQIANTFKDYDEHLLFEGYNEMLDSYGSWCFASFYASGNYNATSASDSYKAINSYAQSFVNAVRATGGNNTERNLIVNTYGSCSGGGTWNTHLKDPLKNMSLPSDAVSGHIAFQVHSYPDIKNGLASAKKEVDLMCNDLKTYLATKAPVIIGEWGTSNSSEDYTNRRSDMVAFAKYFVEKCKANGFAPFYWMGLSDGASRLVPEFNQTDIKDAIIKGYYGNAGYSSIEDITQTAPSSETFTLTGTKVPSTASLPAGIYIRNGRKMVVK